MEEDWINPGKVIPKKYNGLRPYILEGGLRKILLDQNNLSKRSKDEQAIKNKLIEQTDLQLEKFWKLKDNPQELYKVFTRNINSYL